MLLRGCPREVVGRIPALGWLVDGESCGLYLSTFRNQSKPRVDYYE